MSDEPDLGPEVTSRPARLLPPAPRSDRPLFFVVAVIVALACASAIGARAAWGAADAWTSDLDGAMTVQIRAAVGETAEQTAQRAAEALSSAPGVASATALSRSDMEALLEPWLGVGAPSDLPLPGLVDIRVEPVAPAEPNDLLAALDAAGIDGDVDDHEQWSATVRRTAGAARTLALVSFAALLGAAIAVTSFATRASLAARADVVEALHLVGAKDGFIAREFMGRFLGLGVRAGILGALLAGAGAGAAYLLTRGGGDDFLPSFHFTNADAIILGLTPLASATVAALTARETVMAALKRMI